jgi:hypothetical protein
MVNSLIQQTIPTDVANPWAISVQKRAFMENFLFIVDKEPKLILLKPNTAQTFLFDNWGPRMLLCKSRQEGGSTGILANFFIDAISIPGLSVAVVSHEDFATRRLLDKIDIFYGHLPDDMKSALPMKHDSDHEKSFPNGSTIYIGTAGQRAFGRGDTIHRCLVSEEAHYADAEKILSGLKEAVPRNGILVRESTPLGDNGYYYNSVQECIQGDSDFKLIILYWWYGDDYLIGRNDLAIVEEDRGELLFTPEETNLILEKNLSEDRIRWRRWKKRSMRSDRKENIFPQEYIESLDTCFLGEQDRVMADITSEMAIMGLKCRDPLSIDGIAEIWKEPEPLGKYIFWVDPCGGEAVSTNDPHDGVILRITPGVLEHVASIYSRLEQKAFAVEVDKWGRRYNMAKLIVERNGVGKGVLNYLVNDLGYTNLYAELSPTGEFTGKWGYYTQHDGKTTMVSDTKTAFQNGRIVTYDRKTLSQLRSLVTINGKIAAKGTARDDRAMSFMGAIMFSGMTGMSQGKMVEGDYVTFGRKK